MHADLESYFKVAIPISSTNSYNTRSLRLAKNSPPPQKKIKASANFIAKLPWVFQHWKHPNNIHLEITEETPRHQNGVRGRRSHHDDGNDHHDHRNVIAGFYLDGLGRGISGGFTTGEGLKGWKVWL